MTHVFSPQVGYCQDYTLCRRKLMADHFGEEYNVAMCEGVCDNCANRDNVSKQPPKDVTEDAKKILEILEEYNLMSCLSTRNC